jgi:hypothetical protein
MQVEKTSNTRTKGSNTINAEKFDHFGDLLGGTMSFLILNSIFLNSFIEFIGRRFKAATIILPNRHPQSQYMLSIDAARHGTLRNAMPLNRINIYIRFFILPQFCLEADAFFI